MSIVKRFNRLLGLEKIDVLVDEKDKSRHIVITDAPESLPQGKSSFLIEVSPYMRKGIELQIDFVDSKGNSIYIEPVSNYLEGTSRTVSVEVYNTVAPGIATMIIVGELEKLPLNAGNYSDTQEIPDDFKGVYNVRLTKEVIINTAEINIQPIKFYSSPRLTAVEKRFGTMKREVVGGPTISSEFKITGKSTIQEPFAVFQSPAQDDDAGQGAGVVETQENQPPNPPDGDIKGDEAEKQKLQQWNKKKSVRGDSRFKRSKRIRRRRSPEDYPYLFTIEDANHTFTTEEIGGEIRFSALNTSLYSEEDLSNYGLRVPVSFNVVTDENDENFPTHYTASIADLENSVTAYTNTPFTKQDVEGNYRILNMSANAKVHYTRQPSASYSLSNIVSYADVTISHLRTFSGEVFKAKVYVRGEGSQDDYKLLAEVPVESPELLVNENSVGVGERTGYFISDPDMNTYWSVSGSTNGLTAASPTSTASYDNSTMLASVMISGSTSVFTDQIRFHLKDSYKFNLTKSIDYDFSFNAIGQKDIDDRALILVYISGSSVKQSGDLYHDESSNLNIEESNVYGRRLGVLEVKKGDDIKKEFGSVRHVFNSNVTGDAIIQFRVIAGQWNLSDISVVPTTETGFSPSFVNFQQELPPELIHKRPDKLDFLVEFYDINNNLADEVAIVEDIEFTGANMVITGDDNNIPGSVFIGGDTTASGMQFGGVDSIIPETGDAGAQGSGFMRSVGYLGFTSASDSSLGGKPGFMIYSGSVLPGSGEDYQGVGLELVGASGSLKFRTSPSVFDVQADSFFVGKTSTQFISGSVEKIEISSSNFHLDNAGNVDMTGTITAEAGKIGGWDIKDGDLRAGAKNSSVTMSGDEQLLRFGSGSTFVANEINGILFGKDTDGKYKFGVGKGGSYVFFDGDSVNIASDDINVTASVFSVDVDQFKLSATNLFVSSSQGGFISIGNPRPNHETDIGGTNKGIFMQGRNPTDNKPKFLAGDAKGARLSYDGDNIFMSSSAFFLGSPTQFVSGSLGNIEISSSNFHLDNAGNVVMSGTVTAAAGEIGGLTIGSAKLSSGTAYEISSSTNTADPVSFISSSAFKVSAGGQVTASGLSLEGGDIGGLVVSSGTVSVGDILKLKNSGQITGSKVLFTGGTIGGFTIDADEIKSANVLIDSGNEKITLGSANAIKLQGGATDNFLAMGSKSTFSNEGTGTAGIIIGMDGTNPQAEFVKDANNYFIFDDGIDIKTDTLKASGSNIILDAPRFFLGSNPTTFVSGSNGNIEISSSAFHLTPEGNISASNIVLGDKSGNNYLQFVGGALTVRGDLAVDSLFLPATIAGATSTILNASSSLDSTGFAKFVSASIGGFVVDSSQINSANNNIVLKSDGGATISGSSIDLQSPKFYLGNQTNFISGSNGNIKIFSTGDTTLSGSSVNIQTPKFYLGEAANFISGSNGNIKIFSTGDTTLSGSSVNIQTPKFYLGSSTQYISGSNSNIEISSSNFHLDNAGNVIMSGKVSATTGDIGGFSITSTAISSSNDSLILRGDTGQISASAAQITGKITAQTGTIGGFNIGSDLDSSAGTLKLKGATGQITASAAQITGKITATDGAIGGFAITSGSISATNFTLSPASKLISLGTGDNIFIADADVGIQLGDPVFADAPFSVTKAGALKSTSGTIGGWVLSSTQLKNSDDDMRIDSNILAISIKNHTFGQQGIQLQFNGGTSRLYVGNGGDRHIKFDGTDVDIKSHKFELDATNLELSSTHASMSLGEGKIRLVGASTSTITVGSANSIKLSDDGTDRFLVVGGKTSFTHFDQSTAGLILGTDNGTTKFELAADANNYISFNGSAFDIKTQVFTLDTANLDINSATKRIEVSDGSNVRVRIGEVDSTAANHFGITVFDGTGTAASDEIVHLSDAKNQIASWSLSPTQISSGNLIIDSGGSLQTADFASNVKGWRITSAMNGSAEFENVRIRGTLSTAVFEKETVNAVGGQLYVANSTAITSSTTVSANSTTMSVVNVTGFVANEVLSAKKVSSTGFGTEYLLVQSASRNTPSSETDLTGDLYVVRGYNSGSAGDASFIGDVSNISQSYEPGQVIVSTGKIGTGYIRLNANPNDVTTPYIDIVERTGSGVYDVELKARLGDLSGLSSGLLFGNASPGFGLFTENVFLKGAITATTGSIEGILHVRTDLLNQVTIGTNVKNTLDGIHINDNNFWYTNGHFRTGFDDNNFIHQSGSALTIKTATFDLDATTLIVDSANNNGSIRLGGSGGPNSPTANTVGIYMDGGGAINVFGNSTNLLRMDGAGSLTMKSDKFNLETSTLKIDSTTRDGRIGLGGTPPTTISGSNTGIYMDGLGLFRAGNPVGGRIEFDGTDTFISSSAFYLGSDAQFLSGSLGNLEISSSAFHLSGGNAIMSGKVTSAEGNIGGFDIAASSITSQIGGLTLNADGGITGSQFLLTGGRITSDVVIQGDLSANSISTPSVGDVLSSISSAGIARFVSASIGGFEVNSSTIKSTSNALIMSSSGQITASAAKISGDITITGGDLAGVSAATISGSADEVSASLASRQTPFETQVVLDSGGMSLNTAAGVSVADYGTTTRIGLAADARTEITSTAISMYSGKVSGTAYKRVAIDNTGKIAIGGAVGADVSISTTDDVIRITPNSGVSIFEDSNNFAVVNSSGLGVTQGGTSVASFGSIVRIGDVANEHISASSEGITIKDGSTVRGTFVAGGVTIGSTSQGHVSMSTADVSIKKDANNLAKIDSDSFDIVLGGQTSASFGATTTIGPTGGSHVSIDSQQISIKRGTTTFLSASAAGLDMSGSIKASGGTIGGFDISTTKIQSATVGDTVNYTVTANGSSNYLIDGVAQPALTFIVGNTYVFDVSDGSNGGHPFRFTESDGGTDYYTTGLTVNGSAGSSGAYVQLTVTQDTPNPLYYRCTNHSSMRNSISITTATPSLILNGSNGQISASAAQITGKITAQTGTIGGFNIATDLDSSAGTLKLKGATGQITASDAQITGKITAQTGTIGGFNIGTDLDASSGTLKLKGATGQITASAAQITGDITANTITANTAGTIGAFTLNSVGLVSSDGNLILSGSGQITASAAQITGKITSTEGTIGGYTIGANTLEGASRVRIDSSGTGAIRLGGSFGPSEANSTTQGIFLGGNGEFGFINGPNERIYSEGSGIFIISRNIDLSVPKTGGGNVLQIQGAAAAETAKIALGGTAPTAYNSGNGVYLDHTGKFLMGSSTGSRIQFDGSNLILSSSNFILGTSGSSYISSSNGQMEISSSKFHIKSSGDLIVRKVDATEGTIGSFHIGGNTLHSGDSDITDTGNVSFVIRADETNSRIQLGPEAPNMTLTAVDGFYADGDGKFRVGKVAGGFVKFDGTNLQVSSSGFILGQSGSGATTGAFLSGSKEGKLEISSSNFHMKSTGDVIMSGKVTAESGDIAGFTINSGSIDSSTVGISSTHSSMSLGSSVKIIGTDDVAGIFGGQPARFATGTTVGAINDDENGFALFRDIVGGSTERFVLSLDNVGSGGSKFLFDTNSTPVLNIETPKFKLGSALTLVGDITATNIVATGSGIIGGFTLDGPKLSVGSDPGLIISGSGLITAGDIASPAHAETIFMGILHQNSDSSDIGAGVIPQLRASIPGGIGVGGGNQLGIQVSAGNYMKIAQADPYFRAGNDLYPYIAYDGILQELTISSSFMRLRNGSGTNPKTGIMDVRGDITVRHTGSFGRLIVTGSALTNDGTDMFTATNKPLGFTSGSFIIATKGTTAGKHSVGMGHDNDNSGFGDFGAFVIQNRTVGNAAAKILLNPKGGNVKVGSGGLTTTGTIQAEQLNSTDDADIAGHLTVDQGLGVGTAGTTTAGLIRATNDVVAFYSSDKRLKDNLIKIGNPLDKISQLNGYEFDWIKKEGIHENEGHDIGVIAQEVEKVIPEIVQTRDNGYKAVKYEKIVPLLIESIKEQQKQIDELKKEVEELKNA